MLIVDRQESYALGFGNTSVMLVHSGNYLRIWENETCFRDFKYQDTAAAKEVFNSVVKAYGRGDNIFEMPETVD